MNSQVHPDLILRNGRITTLDSRRPDAASLSIKNGLIAGVDDEEQCPPGPNTVVINLNGSRVIPGLNDSHTHPIRGGLNYNMELRWDGVRRLADALRMLNATHYPTPTPQWVRVVGG